MISLGVSLVAKPGHRVEHEYEKVIYIGIAANGLSKSALQRVVLYTKYNSSENTNQLAVQLASPCESSSVFRQHGTSSSEIDYVLDSCFLRIHQPNRGNVNNTE